MQVFARPAAGRELGAASFTKITPVPVTEVSWAPNGFLRVTFDGDLTADEQAAVRRHITSPDTATAEIRAQAARAVAGNKDFLAIAATATNAQVRDQVAALTRQMNAVIRLVAE